MRSTTHPPSSIRTAAISARSRSIWRPGPLRARTISRSMILETRSVSFRPFIQPLPREHPALADPPRKGTWPFSRLLAAPSSQSISSTFSTPPGRRHPTSPALPTGSSPGSKEWRRRTQLWRTCASSSTARYDPCGSRRGPHQWFRCQPHQWEMFVPPYRLSTHRR